MNAQPPPPPPPPPPEQPGDATAQQPISPAPAYAAPPAYGTPDDGGEQKASAGLRILGGVAFLVILIASAIAVISMVDIAGWTPCHEANRDPSLIGHDCFDGSSNRQVVTLILGFAGSALAIASLFLTAAFVIRGRGAKVAALTFLAGAVLYGIGIAIGSMG